MPPRSKPVSSKTVFLGKAFAALTAKWRSGDDSAPVLRVTMPVMESGQQAPQAQSRNVPSIEGRR